MGALRPGDQVPHFDVRGEDRTRISYGSIWQRKHLVLVVLPAGAGARYASELTDAVQSDGGGDVEVIVTSDQVDGVERPGVLVADRWGEVMFAGGGGGVSALPAPGEIADWVRYVRMKCPECEGESR
jgi:hypothetical protein